MLDINPGMWYYNTRKREEHQERRKEVKTMSNYITYVIKNTNNDEFMVCRREGKVDSLRATNIYKTYEESYKVAKAYNFGREPMDETRHH